MQGRALLLAALLVLAGCNRGEPAGGVLGGGAGSELEAAAIERGVVIDAESSEPMGFYERSHTSGSDGFCLMPEILNKPGAKYSFGVSISFGTDLYCEGRGTAIRDGANLALTFDDAAGCAFDATYEGDAIKLAGTVPDACKQLCSPRGTFAGAEMRRVGWDAKSALSLKSRKTDGTIMCNKEFALIQ